MYSESFLCISEYFGRLSHCIGQIAAGSTQSTVSINATSVTGHIQRGRSLHLQSLAQVAMGKHRVAQTFSHMGSEKQDVVEISFSVSLSRSLCHSLKGEVFLHRQRFFAIYACHLYGNTLC